MEKITSDEFFGGYTEERRGGSCWSSHPTEASHVTSIISNVVGVMYKKEHGQTGIQIINCFYKDNNRANIICSSDFDHEKFNFNPSIFRERDKEVRQFIKLSLDPTNKYDKYAIKVSLFLNPGWREVGFVPSMLARNLNEYSGNLYITSFVREGSHINVRMLLDTDKGLVKEIDNVIRKTIPKKRNKIISKDMTMAKDQEYDDIFHVDDDIPF